MKRMIYESKLPIKDACRVLNMSRSTYYSALSHSKEASNLALKALIEPIVLEFTRYGYRRVTKELHRRGKNANHKRVLRIMKENNLTCKIKKRYVVTTDSDHNLPVFKNLANNIIVSRLNQLWVADITYILLPSGHVYLAVIIDVYSRKCIGWHLDRRIDSLLALKALEMAISERKHFGLKGLIHHSDHGVQYASHEYVNRLYREEIVPSMSRRGNPYDNAFAESFIKTLKAEEVYVKEYKTIEEAYFNIKEFIEVVYNKKRLHSSIDYMPPCEFENEVLNRMIVR